MSDVPTARGAAPEWTLFFSSDAAARRVVQRLRRVRARDCAHLCGARLCDDRTAVVPVPGGQTWDRVLDVPVLAALAGADVDHVWTASRCPDADLTARLRRLLRVTPTGTDEAELFLLGSGERVRIVPRARRPPPPTALVMPVPRRLGVDTPIPRVFTDDDAEWG